ncbi:MAG TPA: hypothetical protein ENK53_03585, partial [Thiotrichales bacterium]|nr:hypothetical protein [Thiotrichales bacterium]
RQGLAIAGELRLDADNGLDLDVRLPGYHPGTPPSSQAVRGTLRLAVERLERLAPWVVALDRLEGRAAGALVITGTLSRPDLALDVRIEEAVVGIPATGVDWTDVRLRLRGSSGEAGIGITGRARSGEGGIAIEGRLRPASLTDWRLELRVSGSDALVAALPEARVVVSPRLRLWLRPRRVRVEGRVTVPEARLKPVKLSQPVRVSPDALVVGAEGDETGAAGWRTAARIEIVLGDDVHFEGGGLRARLGGRLTVIDRGEGVPVANGRLAIREGTFRLQGAPIAIRRGMLLYADTPLEDPGLDILLERETERALVRARIGGTLQAPVLELSSDPPLPQTETLALLLTGREASDAGPAEGRWLLEAARRLGLVGGNLLGQRLGESIGLAEARLSLGESLNEAALALGTWLSPRLYVSWTIGLFDPVAAMRIRYRLGRHLQLEINSGAEGSGGDILYTIEK